MNEYILVLHQAVPPTFCNKIAPMQSTNRNATSNNRYPSLNSVFWYQVALLLWSSQFIGDANLECRFGMFRQQFPNGPGALFITCAALRISQLDDFLLALCDALSQLYGDKIISIFVLWWLSQWLLIICGSQLPMTTWLHVAPSPSRHSSNFCIHWV